MHIVLPQLYEPFLANRWALYQQNQITTCLALLLVAGIHSGSYQAQFGSLFSVRVMAFVSFCLAVLVAEGFLLNALTSSQFSLLSMIFWRKYYIYIQGSREGNSKCMCYLKIIILSALCLLLNCVLRYTFRTCIFLWTTFSGNAPTVIVHFFSYFWCSFATTILWSFQFLVSLNLKM